MANSWIQPYRHNGGWAFDDPSKGLKAEPLIGGTDTLLDRLVKYWESEGPVTKVGLRFSNGSGGHFRLLKIGARADGTEYELSYAPSVFEDIIGHRAWLSPTLKLYFEKAPEVICFTLAPWPAE